MAQALGLPIQLCTGVWLPPPFQFPSAYAQGWLISVGTSASHLPVPSSHGWPLATTLLTFQLDCIIQGLEDSKWLCMSHIRPELQMSAVFYQRLWDPCLGIHHLWVKCRYLGILMSRVSGSKVVSLTHPTWTTDPGVKGHTFPSEPPAYTSSCPTEPTRTK